MRLKCKDVTKVTNNSTEEKVKEDEKQINDGIRKKFAVCVLRNFRIMADVY